MELPLNILIVEDSESDAELIYRHLTKGGLPINYLRVETAEDFKFALEHKVWDVIIADYNLPQFDAPSALSILKASEKDIPFIVVSGMIGEETAVALMKAGASDYLMKNKLARLVAVIKREILEAQIRKEHKLAEDAFRLASTVYQIIGQAIMVTDADTTIVAVNPAFTELTGYSASEVIGKTPALLKSGQHSSDFYKLLWHSLEKKGTWQGEIWNRKKGGEIFAASLSIKVVNNDKGIPHRYVALFSDITEKKLYDELIWRQSNFDSLTQLPNRRMSQERLEQEIKKAILNQESIALLLIDLDHFKDVNDTLGHNTGDALLMEAAQRISMVIPNYDTVARVGGDEFTVIIIGQSNVNKVESIAQAIIRTINEPFIIGSENIFISASIGITLFPVDGSNPEQLLKNADQAMYAAKNQGRNCFSYFTKSMQELALARQILSKDLRTALANDEFVLLFQPIIELSSGKVQKAEALLRWKHPERGTISPAEFIPVAEETGLINSIGDWVFKQSVFWAKRWSELSKGSFQVSVNKSPVQFYTNVNYQQGWLDHLSENSIPGEYIVIEITESLLLGANTWITEKMNKYRNMGIKVAIDDFGTGYSALSYLKKFKLDFLKIDQSFVANLASDANDLALTEAIIIMAHKLDLKVIAEGIETEVQKKILTEAGCDFGQGYFFSRPIPPDQFEQLYILRAE